jgi:aspartyl-tRNA(Asn)/glutamyl-tRNA(Gln) amidotransferase subunit C
MTKDQVSQDVVRKVARLARIDLTEAETRKLSGDLNEILSAFRKLQKIDTKGVEPSFRPIGRENVTREDRIEPSVPRKVLLKNLKNKENGYIRGPGVV